MEISCFSLFTVILNWISLVWQSQKFLDITQDLDGHFSLFSDIFFRLWGSRLNTTFNFSLCYLINHQQIKQSVQGRVKLDFGKADFWQTCPTEQEKKNKHLSWTLHLSEGGAQWMNRRRHREWKSPEAVMACSQDWLDHPHPVMSAYSDRLFSFSLQ